MPDLFQNRAFKIVVLIAIAVSVWLIIKVVIPIVTWVIFFVGIGWLSWPRVKRFFSQRKEKSND